MEWQPGIVRSPLPQGPRNNTAFNAGAPAENHTQIETEMYWKLPVFSMNLARSHVSCLPFSIDPCQAHPHMAPLWCRVVVAATVSMWFMLAAEGAWITEPCFSVCLCNNTDPSSIHPTLTVLNCSGTPPDSWGWSGCNGITPGALRGFTVDSFSIVDSALVTLRAYSFTGLVTGNFLVRDPSITTIQPRAFDGMTVTNTMQLETMGVSELQSHALGGVSGEGSFTLSPHAVTTIGADAFSNSSFRVITLSDGALTTVSPFAFRALSSLQILFLQTNQVCGVACWVCEAGHVVTMGSFPHSCGHHQHPCSCSIHACKSLTCATTKSQP